MVGTTDQQENLEINSISRTRKGAKRSLIQISSTIEFEFKRNLRSFIILLLAVTLIYGLFLTINLIKEGRGVESPEDPVDYITGYLMMIDVLIMIIGTTTASTIIAEDYNKHTGNLIFPKITKERLLTGRIIARYIYAALATIFFYILVGVTTLIKYGTLPAGIWLSLLWALLYTFLVFALVVFFSSFMKNTSGTVILSILMLFMIFPLGNNILMFTGVDWEPLFILTYYSKIITASFNMPEQRYTELSFGHRPGGPTYMTWVTPSVGGAIIGMLTYALVLIIASYYLFTRRQQQEG